MHQTITDKTMHCSSFLLLPLLIQFCVSGILHAQAAHRFGYTNFEQKKWRQQHLSCGGDLQSPIRIDSGRAMPLRMPALEVVRYHDLLPGPLELRNNGHSVSMSIPKLRKDDPYAKYVPYIFGARLQNEYELEGLHFHWGDTNNLGAEHVFNDIRYPLEMHIIHRNRKYENVADALNYSDGLTVLGFFYQIREKENKELAKIVRMLKYVNEFESGVKLNETFTLASLVPPTDEMDIFYTYKGSLTTPPCSEAVTWILFPDPMPVTLSQMNKFRSLQADDRNAPLINNYRHVQNIGRRRVFVRKIKAKGVTFNDTLTHYDKWDWLMQKRNP